MDAPFPAAPRVRWPAENPCPTWLASSSFSLTSPPCWFQVRLLLGPPHRAQLPALVAQMPAQSPREKHTRRKMTISVMVMFSRQRASKWTKYVLQNIFAKVRFCDPKEIHGMHIKVQRIMDIPPASHSWAESAGRIGCPWGPSMEKRIEVFHPSSQHVCANINHVIHCGASFMGWHVDHNSHVYHVATCHHLQTATQMWWNNGVIQPKSCKHAEPKHLSASSIWLRGFLCILCTLRCFFLAALQVPCSLIGSTDYMSN